MKHHCKNRYPHVAVATIVALFSLAASGARAELKPVFAELKLFNSPATLPTIEVEAEGKDWTAVSTQTLHVTTNYFVSLKNGSITTISATFENSPISQSRHPGGGKRRWGEFHFAIPHSQLGVLKHFAIDACNQKKKSGARTDETHTAFAVVPFKLFVRAERVGNQSTKTIDGSERDKLSMNAFDSDMMALINNDPAANSGWVRLKVECPEVLSGTLVLRSIAAGRCKAEAAFSVRTNSPGGIDYQLDCTGGRSWSGTTRAQQTDGETYIGIGTKRFNVTNNEQINCALKKKGGLMPSSVVRANELPRSSVQDPGREPVFRVLHISRAHRMMPSAARLRQSLA